MKSVETSVEYIKISKKTKETFAKLTKYVQKKNFSRSSKYPINATCDIFLVL